MVIFNPLLVSGFLSQFLASFVYCRRKMWQNSESCLMLFHEKIFFSSYSFTTNLSCILFSESELIAKFSRRNVIQNLLVSMSRKMFGFLVVKSSKNKFSSLFLVHSTFLECEPNTKVFQLGLKHNCFVKYSSVTYLVTFVSFNSARWCKSLCLFFGASSDCRTVQDPKTCKIRFLTRVSTEW